MFAYGSRDRDHLPGADGSFTPTPKYLPRTKTFDLRTGAVTTSLRSPAGININGITKRSHIHNERIDDEYESDPDQDGEYGEAHANISAAHSAIITKVWKFKSASPVPADGDAETSDQDMIDKRADEAFMKLLDLSETEEGSLDQITHEKSTLLHQLVELPLQIPGRISVARIILQKTPTLLEQRDKDGITPFHKCIKRQRKNEEFLHFFLDKYPIECTRIINETSPKGSALHLAISSKIDDCVVKMLPLVNSTTLKAKNEEGNTVLHLCLDVKDWTSWKSVEKIQQRFGVIQTLVARCPEALQIRNAKSRSPYQHHMQSLKMWLPDERFTPEQRELIEGKDGMSFFLKNEYIRLFKLGEAQNLLYGTDSCPMINFDLSEFTGRALPINLLDRLNHLYLEDVLKVVHLPLLKVAKPNPNVIPVDAHGRTLSKSKTAHEQQKTQGTIYFHDVFRWLSRRGVRKIMSIVVQDDDDAPHGDEHIEQALKNFDVEIFDWRKYDLSSETILAAAPNVREVTLYTRGNRAVLRGWSAPDGLITLPKLSRVRLRVVAPIESEERIRFNLDEFTYRMTILCQQQSPPREIKLPRADRESWGNFVALNSLRPSESSGTQGRKETDTWLKAMEFFRPFLENLPENVEKSAPVVRIAILDDGVDVCADELIGRIAQGQSYCRSSSTEDQHSMHFVSGGGHGTAMARLVCKVFNKVELLIVKLDGANTGKPTAISAAQGIKWAVSEGVDIISMSWSIMESKENEQGIVALVGEVDKAHRAGVLMFCAASDEGVDVMQKRVYPASCDGVICIGAAKSTGKIDESVGKQKVDYIVPGKVYLEALDPTNEPQELSGSSVSTALAAGLAGLILYCVAINSTETLKLFPQLHHKRYMEKVLDSLVSQSDPHNKLICVNDHFKPEFAEEAWEEGAPPPKLFQNLVKRLLKLVDQ